MTNVITREQIIPLLAEACPSFSAGPAISGIVYMQLGRLAGHLLTQYQVGQTREFAAVAAVIERLHLEGDAYVREAATIGLLEGIQNVWSGKGEDPEVFAAYLLPESRSWWQSLNNFWAGNSAQFGSGKSQSDSASSASAA